MENIEKKEKQSIFSKVKSFGLKFKRVFKLTKKPGKDELKIIVKVTGIGIAIIGAIGFFIHLIWKLLD